MQTRTLLYAILAAGILTGCGEDSDDAAAYELAPDYALIARDIIHGNDQVSPDDLAQWVIEGRQDFVLLDVRSSEDFESGHIDTARSTPLTYLVEARTLDQLPDDRKLVLYSNATEHAAQAAVMLRLAGLNAYALEGGYNFWQQRVLNPDLAAQTDAEVLEQEKRRAIACYFAGNYRGAGSAEAVPGDAAGPAFSPAVEPVEALPKPIAPAPAPGLIIEEGC